MADQLSNGFTPETAYTEQARNLADILRHEVGEREAATMVGNILAHHGAVTAAFVYELEQAARFEMGRNMTGGFDIDEVADARREARYGKGL